MYFTLYQPIFSLFPRLSVSVHKILRFWYSPEKFPAAMKSSQQENGSDRKTDHETGHKIDKDYSGELHVFGG